jgi:hypothetical protein
MGLFKFLKKVIALGFEGSHFNVQSFFSFDDF